MMGKIQKVLTTILWAGAVCVALALLGLWLWNARHGPDSVSAVKVQVQPMTSDGTLPVFYAAPAFSLIDQNEKPISDADLRGQVWVAAFIFTNCAGPCPMVSARMGELQISVADPRVKLVSFTVDPQRDTPQVLRQYAAKFDADESRWHFVTGEKSKIYDFIRGMKLTAEPLGENDILHETRLLLIDAQGNVRGIYSIDDPAEMKHLAVDAQTLARQGAEVPAP